MQAKLLKRRGRERKGRKEKNSYIIIYTLAMHDTMLAMNMKMNDENGRKPRTNDMILQTRSPEDNNTRGEAQKKYKYTKRLKKFEK